MRKLDLLGTTIPKIPRTQVLRICGKVLGGIEFQGENDGGAVQARRPRRLTLRNPPKTESGRLRLKTNKNGRSQYLRR